MNTTTATVQELEQFILGIQSHRQDSTNKFERHQLDSRELVKIFRAAHRLRVAYATSFYVDDGENFFEIELQACDYPPKSPMESIRLSAQEWDVLREKHHFFVAFYWVCGPLRTDVGFGGRHTQRLYVNPDEQPSLLASLQKMVKHAPDCKIAPETLLVMAPEVCQPGDRPYDLTKDALLQFFGVVSNARTDEQDPIVSRKNAIRDRLLRNLDKGATAWNDVSMDERAFVDWKEMDFSAKKLASIDLRRMDLCNSTFSNSDLTRANIVEGALPGCNFTGANLSGAKLNKADLRNATFSQANLSKAKLISADLRDSNLSTANITGADFKSAIYSEGTKFPPSFDGHALLTWKGIGPDPLKLAARSEKFANECAKDTADLVAQLRNKFDGERLKKSLAMLSKDRFQLYADVSPTDLIGVVKSQTTDELLYACQLRADGTFSCCTQNLNPCGGLRGALCKHLLVLVIGLVKDGKSDPAQSLRWILSSCLEEKPNLDRDRVSEVFLRYQAAQSGEMDWRPTETIPEDYYSL